ARAEERPGAIQAIRDRVLRPEWHVAFTAVDALPDLPALQGDVIIHKTPHHSIVARKTTTTQGLTVREIVHEGSDRSIGWGRLYWTQPAILATENGRLAATPTASFCNAHSASKYINRGK